MSTPSSRQPPDPAGAPRAAGASGDDAARPSSGAAKGAAKGANGTTNGATPPPDLKPLNPPTLPFAIGGMIAWAIAWVVVFFAFRDEHPSWPGICIAGFVLGFPGVLVMSIHDRNQRGRRGAPSRSTVD